MDMAGEWIFFGIGALSFLVGAGLFALADHARRKGARSRTWPWTHALVLESRIEESTNSRGEEMCAPAIRYRYRAGGKDHESDRIEWGGKAATSDRAWAQDYVTRFPEGARVKVHYDPDDPGEAVLDPEGMGAANVARFASLVFLTVGVLFMAIAWFALGLGTRVRV